MLPGMGAVGKINSMCLVYNFITGNYPITKNSKKKKATIQRWEANRRGII